MALVLDDGPCRYGQPSSVVRVKNNHFEILREGVVGEATLKRLAGVMVLFVCTGNTCRSPMAELLMRAQPGQVFEAARSTSWKITASSVMSAGIAAAPGCPPTSEAVQVMREQGLDLSRHEAQPLTEQLVRHADLILAMTAKPSAIDRRALAEAAGPHHAADARPSRRRRPDRADRRRLSPLCRPTRRRQ